MRDLQKVTTYIDTKTGEVVKEGKSFVNAQFDEEEGYLFWNRRSHNKAFHEIKLPSELTWAERGRLEELSRHVFSTTNMLAYRGNGGLKPYTIKKIGEVIGLGERQTKRLLKKYMDLKVMEKGHYSSSDKEYYYLNPLYFFSSKRIPLNLYLIFKDSLDEHLPEWVINKYREKE